MSGFKHFLAYCYFCIWELSLSLPSCTFLGAESLGIGRGGRLTILSTDCMIRLGMRRLCVVVDRFCSFVVFLRADSVLGTR